MRLSGRCDSFLGNITAIKDVDVLVQSRKCERCQTGLRFNTNKSNKP